MKIIAHPEKIISPLLWVATAATLIVSAIYFLKFHGDLSNNQSIWGTFGDFLGGVLNPILSFLGFVALIITVNLQLDQIKDSKIKDAESMKMAERVASDQARAAKSQEIASKIAVIKLLLSYDGKQIMERGNESSFVTTFNLREVASTTTTDLLKELGQLYKALKNS